jgi:hypothetical protein
MKTVILSFLPLLVAMSSFGQSLSWSELEAGLNYTEMKATVKSEYGNNLISILKIDPRQWQLGLYSASEKHVAARPIDQWAQDYSLTAACNAGMYKMDFVTNRDYMRNFDHVNNPNFTSDNAFVAFNPKIEGIPAFQIIDRRCEDFDLLFDSYETVIQGIRMIDCNGKNRWTDQPEKWSMVCFAEDNDGNALMIFTRSPHKVHDFVNMIIDLDLNITNAMYLEGGPEASLYIDHTNLKKAMMGSYETGFKEDNDNTHFWSIPNIIGISRY